MLYGSFLCTISYGSFVCMKFPILYGSFLCTKHPIYKKIKNIKNVKRCRDGMPKSMQTRYRDDA